MSGHSKWHSIKHKKGAADAKRGKLFTRIIKELTVAARDGGGDPDSNPRLRTVIADAKAANMPADNIKRAIRRGTGEEPGVHYEEVTYEGYGPGGVALMVEVLTDNKNRAVGEVRHLLTKHGGNLGSSNSVAWLFDKRGYVLVDRDAVDEEALMTAAIDAGADDFRDDGSHWEIISAPESFDAVAAAVRALGVEPASAQVAMLPQNSVVLEGKPAQQMMKLDGRARGPRRHPSRLVELRREREGDRGLIGVRIFGIDPGSGRTGYGCIDSDGSRCELVACGAITVPAGCPFPDRLVRIFDALAAMLAAHGPACVAVEDVFHGRNARSALKLGQVRGGRPARRRPGRASVAEYAAASVKQAVVGYGRADKRQVQRMVALLLDMDEPPSPHDVADALAVAVCHAYAGPPAAPGGSAGDANAGVGTWRRFRVSGVTDDCAA